jgi:hypothetical protein
MKNVEILQRSIPSFRVPIHGMPPLNGWGVQYVSGMEAVSDIKPNYWLSEWHLSAQHVTFNFESALHMCFKTEEDANRASQVLLDLAEITTKVVRVVGGWPGQSSC